MAKLSLKNSINLSNAKALRRARELMKVTRNELAARLELSPQAIEKYESGRAVIDLEKIKKYLTALDLTDEDLKKIKRGKGITRNRKKKSVFYNDQRRSYQKLITKEVRVLKIMRQMMRISQDRASALCGYSRPSIGHIENGRIELTEFRVRHILKSYGRSYGEFKGLVKEEVLRDEIVEMCLDKLNTLSEEKLKIVSSLIQNF